VAEPPRIRRLSVFPNVDRHARAHCRLHAGSAGGSRTQVCRARFAINLPRKALFAPRWICRRAFRPTIPSAFVPIWNLAERLASPPARTAFLQTPPGRIVSATRAKSAELARQPVLRSACLAGGPEPPVLTRKVNCSQCTGRCRLPAGLKPWEEKNAPRELGLPNNGLGKVFCPVPEKPGDLVFTAAGRSLQRRLAPPSLRSTGIPVEASAGRYEFLYPLFRKPRHEAGVIGFRFRQTLGKLGVNISTFVALGPPGIPPAAPEPSPSSPNAKVPASNSSEPIVGIKSRTHQASCRFEVMF